MFGKAALSRSTIYTVTTIFNVATFLPFLSQCREACEELVFRQCDREFKVALDFNRKRQQFPEWPFFWDVVNCTTLPFRSESSNCYYPDKIRGQFTNRRISGTGGNLALIINLTVVQALACILMRYFFVNKGV